MDRHELSGHRRQQRPLLVLYLPALQNPAVRTQKAACTMFHSEMAASMSPCLGQANLQCGWGPGRQDD